MNDNVVLLVIFAVALLVVGVLMFQAYFIAEPPNQVVIPIEEVHAAVMPFQDLAGGGRLGLEMQNRIEAELVNRPGIKVFSRTQLATILAEQRFSALGLTDPSTSVELGHLTGVNKIIVGSVLRMYPVTENTWICTRWQLWPPACLESQPAVEVKLGLDVAFQIINAQTGQVEVARTASKTVARTLAAGSQIDPLSLMPEVMEKIAAEIADQVQAGYTEEISYGFYKDVRKKAHGLEGVNPSKVFTRLDPQIILLVHIKRVRSGATFFVEWTSPDGTVIKTQELIVSDNMWLPLSLPLYNVAPGTWRVAGYLNGRNVFVDDVSVF